MKVVSNHTSLVAVRDLVIGMEVRDIRLPWWQHEFFRGCFSINSEAIIHQLSNIDPNHLVEVVKSSSEDGSKHAMVDRCKENDSVIKPSIKRLRDVSKHSDIDVELDRAKRLVKDAKKAISLAMEGGRTGSIKNLSDIEGIAAQMVDSTMRNPGALQTLSLLKTVDDYTFTHCVAVGTFMISLGKTLGFDDETLVQVGTGGLLHDVGKAGISKQILNKPGKLTSFEYEHVKLHPVVGEQVLRDSGFDTGCALDIVRHHHEKVDGTGYPDKLLERDTTTFARMGAVTDVFDAVTSNRVYQRAMAPTAALQLLMSNSGTQFDKSIVTAFVQTMGLFPNGSLVKLASGKLAFVKEQSAEDVRRPKVRVFFSIKSGLPLIPYDLQLYKSSDLIESFEELATWKLEEGMRNEILGLA